jgi:two-component system, NtrC family, nitrogen regulation sensor histidine kinase NtrY
MATTSAFGASVPSGALRLFRVVSVPSLLAFVVALGAVVSGILTYVTLSGLAPFQPSLGVVVVLLVADLTLVLSLGGLIAWRVTRLWMERRSGIAGSRLHIRLVATFAVIAVLPAILVAAFAAVSFNLGLEAWFSERVQTALDNSVSVADAYVEEHNQVIRSDVLAMALDLNRAGAIVQGDQKRIVEILETEAKIRALPAVYVVDSSGRTLASAKLQTMPDRGPVTPAQIEEAKNGDVVVLAEPTDDAVSALVKLEAFVDAYLLVTRTVDPQVLAHRQGTHDAVSEYRQLSENRGQVQLAFAALYAAVAILILLGAISLALWAANRIVTPIGRLAGAAERVSEGDLSVRVEIGKDDEDIGSLSETFNRMTSQLEAQRKELTDANHQLDARRRFTEAMLAGVSAGVVGLDGEGRVTLINRTAAALLGIAPEDAEGHHYMESMAELASLIGRAMAAPEGRLSGEIDIRRDGPLRHLNVQVSREAGDKMQGFVVTFDDITDLVSAQRTAAWADVARRIAHEIKNPLTPIQLSAERLKRKYASEVTSDPEVFKQCTDTIVRQVGDIGRMVDEFSSFARMPAPVLRNEEAQELVRHAIFLQRVAHPQIAFETTMPPAPVVFECDGRLVSQALTNVLKNAIEAIAVRMGGGNGVQGKIALEVAVKGARLTISVRDNGIGLPAEDRHRLTEPYVTTRAKGTGLGLAIVRKIMEDHGGELSLEDAVDEKTGERTGALVRMVFPLHQQTKTEQPIDKGMTYEQERIADRV